MTDSVQSGSRQFCTVWRDALTAVVAQLGLASPVATIGTLSVATTVTPGEHASRVAARFTCSGALQGELVWVADQPVALRFAQLLASGPADPSAEFSDIQRDVFSEFMRQVAGEAAAIWRRETGQEITLAFQADPLPPEASFLQGTVLQVSGQDLAEVTITMLVSADLSASLEAFTLEPAAEATSTPEPMPSKAHADQILPSNLELLLDVELEATIRFGERELLLRDVFALMPGSVVELNQTLNEPAELLVAGRTIARGEVVVVDGHFGLRVSEVASRSQRTAVLQT